MSENLIKHTINQTLKPGEQSRIEAPLMYKGFIIKNKKTEQGYKLYAYNVSTDVFINPLYNSFKAIKLIIDNIR